VVEKMKIEFSPIGGGIFAIKSVLMPFFLLLQICRPDGAVSDYFGFCYKYTAPMGLKTCFQPVPYWA